MKDIRWLTFSQSVAILGAGLVFPFYILFIKGLGVNFTEFGIAYGIFTISSALVHKWIGKSCDRFGNKLFLMFNSFGMAIIFLIFPIVTNMWQVYFIQVLLGVFGAMQKTSEKVIIANFTDGVKRGERIGIYHGWLAIFSGLAVMVGGYLADLLTLEIIFYIGSIFLFLSGLVIFKVSEDL
ncbi:MFS transporter [Candidatus Pacearchaeota archaeon CG10_big_fil_rev_8_21_14_0_10_31_24]|nr:MAG: MFS transporter [Candidatus Pacearchaeota archaeon CG10_big_fil_rev_8_21_14_0_10_31_24]